jgi:mxaJ protein
VARGTIDVAVAWGPLAGFFAKHSSVPLAVTPIAPSTDARTGTVFAFPIAMGVQKSDTALRNTLERVIERDGDRIHAILVEYGVPVLAGGD